MVKIKSLLRKVIKVIVPDQVTLANVSVLAPSELLKGRRALITGGTSGIGYAIARSFLQAGASVAITSRSEERASLKAKELMEYVKDGCQVVGIGLDNNCPSQFESIITKLNMDGRGP